MASGNYDHANVLARKYMTASPVGGAATTTYAKMPVLNKSRIRNVGFSVLLAGTATTHKFDIYNGTDSIGAVTLGTSVAGSVGTSGDLNSAIAAGGYLSVKSGADATGTAGVVFELSTEADATWS